VRHQIAQRRRYGARRRYAAAVPDEEHAIPPIEEILNRVPGAFARTQEGLAQARRNEGIPLDALGDEPPQRPPDCSGPA
jgi:hypothetical protein